MEERYKRKEIRNFYKDVKELRRGYQVKTIYYRNKEGNLISEDKEVVERWREYFNELLNAEVIDTENNEEIDMSIQHEEIEEPTREEINDIIDKLKNNKSPGENGITAENIKYGGTVVREKIYEIIRNTWTQEVIPESWNKALILPIHKKGDKADCTNYRGIALLDVTYKILSTWIKNKIEQKTEKLLGDYQAGFRKGRSTTDQIFTLKQILVSCYEYETPLFVLFVDFKRAYDSVNRNEIVKALRRLHIPEKLIRLTSMTLQRNICAVKINGNISNYFEVKSGLRQGDPLSTLLFNVLLEEVIRDSGINTKGTIFTKSRQCLAYADDLVLIARNKKQLMDMTEQLITAAKRRGLYINTDKSNYMRLKSYKSKEEEGLQVRIDEEENVKFKEVDSFVYLGTLITDKCNEETEVDFRILKSNRSASGLHTILKSKEVSIKTKIRVYKTVLRPTLVYGSETWVMNKKVQTKIETWERKVLRRIFGGKRTEEGWERRTNREVYELFNEPIISEVVKAKRLQWAGHLERMEDDRVVKSIGWREPEGKRRKGRPRRKWKEAIADDLKEKKITQWRTKAKDRRQWRQITQLWA